MPSNSEVAERFLEDFNRRGYSVDRMREYVAEDAVFTLPTVGLEFHGPNGAIQLYESWVQPFSDARANDMTTVDRGEYVETQFRGTGTFDGAFMTPQGTFNGDGSRFVDLAFINRYWIQDGKITRVEGHFDAEDMLRQMGLA